MTAPKRYNRILFTAAGALLLAAFGISLLIGAYPLTAQDILSALSGGEGMAVKVFWRLRLPRSLAAMVSGMALGVCGAVYQILFANPLAAPDIMGVSGGATLGAAMAIVWGNTAFSAPAAFLGGMAALAGSLLLTRASGSRGTGAMVLSGVLISALMKMGVMLLKTFADTEGELAAIEFFTMGSFSDITAAALPALLFAAALGFALLTLLHRQIGLLSLPDDEAQALGVSTGVMRALVLAAATLLAAAVSASAGVVAFLPLIAPHGARLLLRGRTKGTFASLGVDGRRASPAGGYRGAACAGRGASGFRADDDAGRALRRYTDGEGRQAAWMKS